MPGKKKIFGIAAALFLLLGDFLYWSLPFSLSKALPKEAWNRAQLWYYDEHFDMRELTVDEETLQKLLTNLEAEKVTNRPRFRGMSQPYFQLHLSYDGGYPCSITIVENGDISIAAELDTDHRSYFDGGEELYAYLLALSKNLPAVFPVE